MALSRLRSVSSFTVTPDRLGPRIPATVLHQRYRYHASLRHLSKDQRIGCVQRQTLSAIIRSLSRKCHVPCH